MIKYRCWYHISTLGQQNLDTLSWPLAMNSGQDATAGSIKAMALRTTELEAKSPTVRLESIEIGPKTLVFVPESPV